MPSLKILFALAALIAVSAARDPHADQWLKDMKLDNNFDGKNDNTGKNYPSEAQQYFLNHDEFGKGYTYNETLDKAIPNFAACDEAALTTVLQGYATPFMFKVQGGLQPTAEEIEDVTTAKNCEYLLLAFGTFQSGGTPNADGLDLLANPCKCWGGIKPADAELLYCAMGPDIVRNNWDSCQAGIALKGLNLITDGFTCQEGNIDFYNLAYTHKFNSSTWGERIEGIYPSGGTAEDCAERCYANDDCGAFEHNIQQYFGPVDTHKRGYCAMFPAKVTSTTTALEVDIAPSGSYAGTRFCKKDGSERKPRQICELETWTPTPAECELYVAKYGCDKNYGAVCPDGKAVEAAAVLSEGCPAACVKPEQCGSKLFERYAEDSFKVETRGKAKTLIAMIKKSFKAIKEDYRSAKRNLRKLGREAKE
jgi:hypothetical protein